MIYTSPHGTLEIPEDKGAWSYVEQHASSEKADTPAFICGVTSRQVTFAEMHTMAKQIVAGLYTNGIRKGDVVILHSFNCIEFPIVFVALNRLGAICSSSPPMLNAEGLAIQIESAGAKAVISHKALAHTALSAARLAGVSEDMVFSIADAPESAVQVQSIEKLIALDLPFPDLPPVNPRDVVFLPFSSGTTGRPKGVQLTGRGLHAVDIEYSSLDPPGKYSLALAPFFRTGIIIFHACIYNGTSTIVLPDFEPKQFLALLEKYQLEKILVPPPIILFLAHDPLVQNYDLSHLKMIVCGGAPLRVEAERVVEERLGVVIVQGYGMTELAGAATCSSPFAKKHGSTGQLIPNVRLKVVSLTTGEPLPPNEMGEFLIHSPSVTVGYLNSPEANQTSFDEDGFLRTGDYGYIDEDGFVFLVDRIKEFIKFEGHQVAPAELEDFLLQHPSVADACCVRGLDFESGEEIPKAYVVLRAAAEVGESGKVSADELMAFVNAKVAPYKQIREVEFTDAIPKNPTGKLLRRELQVKENEKIQLAKAVLEHP